MKAFGLTTPNGKNAEHGIFFRFVRVLPKHIQ